MTLDSLLRDIHAMEEDLLMYERKYGVLSSVFYESYMRGEEPPDGAWVLDWNGWAATYEIWQNRRRQFGEMVQALQQNTSLIDVIERAARRESIPVPA